MGLDKTFKDSNNDFSCDTLEEWIAHLATTELTYTGNSACVTCGENVNFNGQNVLLSRAHTDYCRLNMHLVIFCQFVINNAKFEFSANSRNLTKI